MTHPPIQTMNEAATLPRLVLIDANVFFSPRLRDLFMALHANDLPIALLRREGLSVSTTADCSG